MATSIIIPKVNNAGTRVRFAVNGKVVTLTRGVATDVDDDLLAAIANSTVAFRLAGADTIATGQVLIPGSGSRVRGTINGDSYVYPVGVPFTASAAVQAQLLQEGISFVIGAGIVVTPTPTPTPTPSFGTINAPKIEQTSVATRSPFTWRTLTDNTYMPGFFWHVRRATSKANLLAGTLNADVMQQITPQDLAGGQVAFPEMGSTPVGGLALYERVGREDGTGGYVWGDWSNVLEEVISATYGAVLSDTQKAGRVSLSADKRTMTTTDDGANGNASVVVSTGLSAANGYIEFTLLTASTSTNKDSVGMVANGYTTTLNYGFNITYMTTGQVSTNTGTTQGGGAGSSLAQGGTVGVFADKASGRVWFRNASGWINGTPVVKSDGTLDASSTGGITNSQIDTFNPAAGCSGAGSWRVNAGQSSFAFGPPPNANPGWA